MPITKIVLEISHEEALDSVAMKNLKELVVFALNDLGDSFSVDNREDEQIFLIAEKAKKFKE